MKYLPDLYKFMSLLTWGLIVIYAIRLDWQMAGAYLLTASVLLRLDQECEKTDRLSKRRWFA